MIDGKGVEPTFLADGAERFVGAAKSVRDQIVAALADLPPDRAGMRLYGDRALASLLPADGVVGSVAATALGPRTRPVRAVLFDKTAATNWALGWHQDRTISVARRIDVEGFGPWTLKCGMPHVAPPYDLLARMATLRVHLDDVPATNAPLLVALGSHKLGRVPLNRIGKIVRASVIHACLACAGDVWLYATPILHASAAAERAARRRVLQVDYAAEDLPGGLEWSGV